jgi:hypothetical protein
MRELPESLQTDVAFTIFDSFVNSDLFPKDERGAILMIVRRCTVCMACEGEYIMEVGELGLEMYFIIEGEVEIISA